MRARARTLTALTATVLAAAFGAAGAQAHDLVSRVAMPQTVGAGAPIEVNIWLARSLRSAHAVLQQQRNGSWTTCASRPIARRATIGCAAPAQAGQLRLRAEVLHRRAVIWRSRATTVTVTAPNEGAPTPPTSGPTTTPTTSAPTTPTTTPTAAPPNPDLGATLSSGQTIASGQYLASPNGSYTLTMQSTGDLTLEKGTTQLWSSGTSADGGAEATMGSDGNLVIGQGSTIVWSSDTSGFAGAELALDNGGNLTVTQSGLTVWSASSGYLGNQLDDETLASGASLLSPNRDYRLTMQGDGNLVLYQGSSALWSTATASDSGATAAMQSDGNLVVYQHGTAVWSANTAGFAGALLTLQNDGNLVVYNGSLPIWDWASGYMGNLLQPGETLTAGEELQSPGHAYELAMQGDGNLVLYQGGTALWSSATAGDDGASVTMQSDGNLVIYHNGSAVWNSSTGGFSGVFLQLQDDGNLVLYQGTDPIWDRGSGYMGNQLEPNETLTAGEELQSPGHGYQLVMQGDGNLVLYQGASALWSSGTAGDTGAVVVMQGDGNLVVYRNGIAVWNSQTAGNAGAYLSLQDDSNLVIYQGSTALWDRGSGRLTGGGGGASTAAQQAIAWAQQYLGTSYDNGLCLQFVGSAYAAAGINIGGADTAADYWVENPKGYAEHPGDTNPPVGALVFWGPSDVDGYSNPAGHVGIYVGPVAGYGSDEVISTWSFPEPESEPDVHYFSLSDMNSHGYPYDGWMMP